MHTSSLVVPLRSAVAGCRASRTTLGLLSRPTCSTYLPIVQRASAASTVSPALQSFPSQKPTLFSVTQKTSRALTQVPSCSPAYVVHSSTGIRFNSTTSSSSSSSSTGSSGIDAQLNWNTFFTLRKSRRRYSLISSGVTSLASTAAGVQFVSAQDLDNFGIMGLDPFFIFGLSIIAFGAVGWLGGPFLGNAVWGLVNRRFRPAFVAVSSTGDFKSTRLPMQTWC